MTEILWRGVKKHRSAKVIKINDKQMEKPTNPKDAIGIKKAPLSTLPAHVILELGTAMLEGAAKYGRFNYRAIGVRASVYYDALQRHILAWWEGEDIDPDSGLPHVTKAMSCLLVLRDAMHQGKLEDDRPPKSQPFIDGLNQRAADILERYKDKQVTHYTAKNTPISLPKE